MNNIANMLVTVAVILFGGHAKAQSSSNASHADEAYLASLMQSNPPPQPAAMSFPPVTTESSVCFQQTCFRQQIGALTDGGGTWYYFTDNDYQAAQVCLTECGDAGFCPQMSDSDWTTNWHATVAYCLGCGPGQLCLPDDDGDRGVTSYCEATTMVALSEIQCFTNDAGGGPHGDPTNGGDK
ncbi:MAG TPA: hypothetical protein VFQ42_22040 [Mycobacterium sp.]|nr:hypothetical protein [Mycobacterium sp.]